MGSNDDGFEPFWTDESDWLVDVVMIPNDQLGDVNLDYIGRLSAFAFVTDTRMLAQVGDPMVPTYELWFSFKNEEQKQTFLQMVRDDGYADPDDECCFDPPVSLGDLADLRPIAFVFPRNQGDYITAVSAATLLSMDIELE